MEFGEIVLNVLAILGIIIIGGFLIFFLGNGLLSIFDQKQSKPEIKQSKLKIEQNLTKQNEKNLEQKNDFQKIEKVEEDTISEFVPDEEFAFNNEQNFENINYDKAPDERRKLKEDFNFGASDFMQNFDDQRKTESVIMQNEQTKEDSDLNNLFNDNDFNFADEFDFNFLDEKPENENLQTEKTDNELLATKNEFENINQFITQTNAKPTENQFTSKRNEFFESNAEFENYLSESETAENNQDTETVNETVNLKVEKPIKAESTVPTPVIPFSEPQNAREEFNAYKFIEIDKMDNIDASALNFETINESRLLEEIKFLKQELYVQKLEYDKLKKEFELNDDKLKTELTELEKLYKQSEQQEVKTAPLLTIEEYEARIEVLKSRLKENEKELKANKKEFLPLRKVRKNLDNDKKKLRRREALVAKQKVMLYGVNNIAEIDEEKAKKLAEDLDLLDGLKISVQHCEEVMEQNKERYPILETTYRILTTVNKDLKDDIAECEANIRKLKGEDTNDSNDEDGIIKEAKTVLTENVEEIKPKKKTERKKKANDLNAESAITEEIKSDTNEVLSNENAGSVVDTVSIANETGDEIQAINNEINVTLSEKEVPEQTDFAFKEITEKDILDMEAKAFGMEGLEETTIKTDSLPTENN